ncbi:MAG: hypothetical protein JO061_17650 [Acidobacteriaceae bacterium]|nr:hypothetical protein [Acidobacteriaceae bacterium]
MQYPFTVIEDSAIPRACDPAFQHVVDTYASESNKVISIWREFTDDDLSFRPHPKSLSVADIFKHQLLSERRFLAEFLETPEPAAADVLPQEMSVAACCLRMSELALRRLPLLAERNAAWWLEARPFFDVNRQRIWIFWRRVLHTAHHRTQLTVYLRLLDRNVPSTYGPTADVTWSGADPTLTVQAAERR